MKTALLPCALAALFPLLASAQPASPRAAAPYAVSAPSTAIRRAAPVSEAAREGLRLVEEGCQSDGYEPEVCERAIAKLEEASRENPEQVEVQLALAQAYWNRGHTESPRAGGRQRWRQRSVDTLQRMVDRNVKDARAYYELSVRQKEDGERVRLLRKTLEMDPRHPRAHQDMAWGLLRQGLGEEAARFYKEHMDSNPVKDREEAKENLRFAEELSRARLPRQAAQVLGKVVEQTRGERRAERCVLFQSVDKQLTESLPALRGELQALRPFCTNTEHLDKAVELERQGRVDEAVKELEEQVATNPKPEETHVMLERLHQRKGEVEKAADAAERQLRAEPDAAGEVRALPENFTAGGESDAEVRGGRAAAPVPETGVTHHPASPLSLRERAGVRVPCSETLPQKAAAQGASHLEVPARGQQLHDGAAPAQGTGQARQRGRQPDERVLPRGQVPLALPEPLRHRVRKVVVDAPPGPAAREITQQMQVEGGQGEQRHPEPLPGERSADRRGDKRGQVSVGEHVMIARVHRLARKQGEPIDVRGQPGKGDEHTVTSLTQALGQQPGQLRMDEGIHGRSAYPEAGSLERQRECFSLAHQQFLLTCQQVVGAEGLGPEAEPATAVGDQIRGNGERAGAPGGHRAQVHAPRPVQRVDVHLHGVAVVHLQRRPRLVPRRGTGLWPHATTGHR